ncbi:MAG TPA: ATP-binding protein [Polyangiaceae bacterium]|nr:ATP-binding protein [Polyangiaceae bacterium]
MYRKHFGLTAHPFGKELDTDDLFASSALKEMQVRLTHLIELRGIGLVTGESGSGKTSACRKVVSALHTGLYRTVYVPHSTGNVMDMYKTIAWELGLAIERSRAALFRQIRSEVTRLCAEARCRPILVIDEAHHLRADVLEDLRLLTNYAMDSENRLCLILIGHPELRRRLSPWRRMRHSASVSSCGATSAGSAEASWMNTSATCFVVPEPSYPCLNLQHSKPFTRPPLGCRER